MSDVEWQEPILGPRGMTVFALIALDLPVVTRTTLRALLPAGTTRPVGAQKAQTRVDKRKKGGGSVNRTSLAFGRGLQALEAEGLIRRTETAVEVVDRRALADYAMSVWGAAPPIPFEYGVALRALLSGESAQHQQREAEMASIRRLMQQAPTRRGSARLVYRSHL